MSVSCENVSAILPPTRKRSRTNKTSLTALQCHDKLHLQTPGGASSSHPVGSRTAAYRPRPGSTATQNARSGTVTPGVAAEWPRAGWGPGSLTISRPPRAAGASETARSTAAVIAAFAGSTNAVRGGPARVVGDVGGGIGDGGGGCDATSAGPSGTEVQRDLYSSSGTGSVSAAARAHALRQSQSQPSVRPVMTSSQSLTEEAWSSGGGGTAKGAGEEEDMVGEHLAMVKAGGDHGSHCPGGDGNVSVNENDRAAGKESSQQGPNSVGGSSMSGGMLLYNLDCGTLEPPSPEPPSPEQRGEGSAAVGPEQDGQQRGNRRRKKRREKRTMTSVYVR